MSDRQFGFRKGISTEQMLLAVTDGFHAMLDTKSPRFIAHLSLDIRKAFDTVDHKLLLYKLKHHFHFSDETVNLFNSYFSNRKQSMKVSSFISPALLITKGVPQGSVLGPLLFNLMVNDMLQSHERVFSYADDTLIYECSNTMKDALDGVKAVYLKLSDWYNANGLCLSPSKTACIVYSNRPVASGGSVLLDDCVVPISCELRLLGVTLDYKLNLTHHVQRVSTSASQIRVASNSVYALRKIRKYLTAGQAMIIYKSMIRSRLEYCSSLVLCSRSATNVDCLERVQNRAVRVILGVPGNTASDVFSVSAAKQDLKLLSLADRRGQHFRALVRKISLGLGAPFLVKLLTLDTVSHNLSLRNRCTYVLPSVHAKHGKMRFTVNAIKVLKGLPLDHA